ncbi:MAG TPA: carboxypeptidase regulatory-like domain-containing protein, partial [Gemmatimonadales bacterium]|nr:carboxypeptidase regulatory-like domain-containing protein [Gemmatimonadales bacterium]
MPVAAQQVDVRGRMVASGAALEGVEVRLGERMVRTAADGRFGFVALAPGTHRLRIRSIGYSPVNREITLPADSVLGDIELEPFDVSLGDLVVTGTLAEVRVEQSPVKVELVTRRSLERNLTTTLMESVRAIPGLREQVDCGVCYTNSISINGMDGPYTAVLFDGVP